MVLNLTLIASLISGFPRVGGDGPKLERDVASILAVPPRRRGWSLRAQHHTDQNLGSPA